MRYELLGIVLLSLLFSGMASATDAARPLEDRTASFTPAQYEAEVGSAIGQIDFYDVSLSAREEPGTDGRLSISVVAIGHYGHYLDDAGAQALVGEILEDVQMVGSFHPGKVFMVYVAVDLAVGTGWFNEAGDWMG